jgi:2,3-bisphosphoglycerate-dependent phosphoglycerate mutase
MRCQETILRIFDHIPEVYPLFIHVDPGKMHTWGNFTSISNSDVPVYVTESLNERYYGKLQGLNKKSVIEKYGEQLVHLWRRGFKIRPPGGESLKDVYGRAVPFFKKHIEKDLAAGKNVLVVASHNSLRALVKYIEHIPDKDIEHVELPFGALAEYEFANGLFALKK